MKHAAICSRVNINYYSHPPECGMGVAAKQNVDALVSLGVQVNHVHWRGVLSEKRADLSIHHHHDDPIEEGQVGFFVVESRGGMCLRSEKVLKKYREVWTPSWFSARSLESFVKRLRVIPHWTDVPARHPSDRVLVVFDAWAGHERKNPLGALRAYDKAGRPGRLTVKLTHAESLPSEVRAEIHRIADTVVEEFIDDGSFDEMVAGSAAVLSLQRGEGFGLNLAKAVSAGVPVITPGFGGHAEFMEGSPFLVNFKNIAAPPAFGGFWAEPDEDRAAELLRWVMGDIAEARERVSGLRSLVPRREDTRKAIRKALLT